MDQKFVGLQRSFVVWVCFGSDSGTGRSDEGETKQRVVANKEVLQRGREEKKRIPRF
jgi:hypothetical protein